MNLSNKEDHRDCFTERWLNTCKEINSIGISGFRTLPYFLVSPGSGSTKTMSKRAKRERMAGNLDSTNQHWKSTDQIIDVVRQYLPEQQGHLICFPIHTFTERGGLKGHKPSAHAYLVFIDFRNQPSKVWLYNSMSSGTNTIPSLLRALYRQKRRKLSILPPTIITGTQPDHEETCVRRSIDFLRKRVNNNMKSADEVVRKLETCTTRRKARKTRRH